MKRSMRFSLLVAIALASGCTVLVPVRGPQPQNSLWACHGGRNPTWRRINPNSAAGHQRHGDFITEAPQQNGQRCGPDQDRERGRERERERGR